MSVAGRKRAVELRNERVRLPRGARLMQAALVDLLAERGYSRVDVRLVCDRAEVARSTFYHHFEDIHQLLWTVAEPIFVELLWAISLGRCDTAAQVLERVRTIPGLAVALTTQSAASAIRAGVERILVRQCVDGSHVQAKLLVNAKAAATVTIIEQALSDRVPDARSAVEALKALYVRPLPASATARRSSRSELNAAA